MLIYNLKDTSQPIVRIEDRSFDESLLCFFTKISETHYAFTLYGDKSLYEINYLEKNGLF